jgi:hypothetical protein
MVPLTLTTTALACRPEGRHALPYKQVAAFAGVRATEEEPHFIAAESRLCQPRIDGDRSHVTPNDHH